MNFAFVVKLILFLLASLLLHLFFAAASIDHIRIAEDTVLAEDAVSKFHADFDEMNYANIYQRETIRDYGHVTEDKFVDSMAAIREVTGDRLWSSRYYGNDKSNLIGSRQLVLFYTSAFQNLERSEKFTLDVDSQTAVIIDYKIYAKVKGESPFNPYTYRK